MGKVWIPASAGMSGWRGFVFFRSFRHTLYARHDLSKFASAALISALACSEARKMALA
jgi:hypothetical protein